MNPTVLEIEYLTLLQTKQFSFVSRLFFFFFEGGGLWKYNIRFYHLCPRRKIIRFVVEYFSDFAVRCN
jgi:hypothetical protein